MIVLDTHLWIWWVNGSAALVPETELRSALSLIPMNYPIRPTSKGQTIGLMAVLLSLFWLTVPPPANAQMVTGSSMTDFAKTFGISAQGWSVQQLECNLGANALWPAETATFTFFIKPGQSYQGPLKVDVIQYGTRGKPGDWWQPVVFKIADVSSLRLNVDLPAKGGLVTVGPKIGDAFGGYAVILELGERGRAFGAACVRVPAPEPSRVWLPTYAMDLGWPHEMSPVVFNVFKRLGVKGARTEGGYNTIRDAHTDWAMANDLTLMLTVGCGNTPREQQPLGRGRPWLRANGEMIEGVKEDLAWLPSFDPEFKRYLKNVLIEQGWPKGPINAVELWNEPWEGVSISGWGADCLRYREIYQVMAEAVIEARQEAGVKVLIGGACSSANTRDKLFCDGTDKFLPWLDFVSIHYQPLAADPVLEPKWMHRQGPYGRVKVWDTESWVANSDDRVAAVIASMRAMGQDRTAGIYAGNVFTSQKPRLNGKEYAVAQVWAPGAAVAACQKFIGQRAFKEILFKNGLPWVFVFDGLPKRVGKERTGPVDPDDGTLVIVGDLGASYDKNRTLFRSVNLAPDAKMELGDGGGQFVLHDFYANPLPSHGDKITVPLNGLGYFLRADGSHGSFARLLAAVNTATITGIDPVEIIAHDMTAPIAARPKLKLKITNVLNRPVKGTLSVRLEGLTVEPAEQAVTVAGQQSREVFVTVTGGTAAADNNYKLLATFDAGRDGTKKHAELDACELRCQTHHHRGRETGRLAGRHPTNQRSDRRCEPNRKGLSALPELGPPGRWWRGDCLAGARRHVLLFRCQSPAHGRHDPLRNPSRRRLFLSGQGHQQRPGTHLAGGSAAVFIPQEFRHSFRQRPTQRPDRFQRHSAGAEGPSPISRRHDAALLRLLRHRLRVRVEQSRPVLRRRHGNLLSPTARHDAQTFLPATAEGAH